MNKGLILAGAGIGLLALVGVAAASTDDEPDDGSPLPSPTPRRPAQRTVAQMVAQVKSHSLYSEWLLAHTTCANYQWSGDTTADAAGLHACSLANNDWADMMSDLAIPASQQSAVFAALGV